MSTRLPAWTAKLAVRIFAAIAVLHLVFLGGAFLGLDRYLEQLFDRTAAAEAETLGRVVTSALRQQMVREHETSVDAILAELAKPDSGTRIRVINRRGRVTHATDRRLVGAVLEPAGEAACAECHAAPAASRGRTRLASGADRVPVFQHVETLENEAACQRCHGSEERLNGIVLVERAAGPFQSALWTIRQRLAGTAALTMAALLGATLLLGRAFVTRPIGRLLTGVHQFGRGNLDYRIAVRGRGEIADLTTAINGMAGDLDRSLDEVRTKTAELTVVYTILERVTRSIQLTDLQLVILQTFLEVLDTDLALLVSRVPGEDALELLWLKRGLARVQTARVEAGRQALPIDVRRDCIDAWRRGDLAEPFIAPDARAAALPITGSRASALLVVERRRPFLPAEANVTLLKVIAQHAAAAYDNACLYTLAVTDPLTRLFTVRLFHEQLDELAAAWSGSGRGFALLMLDLDHFKAVNDTHGHPAGDEVLKAASGAIREAIRLTDGAYRYGGEEFSVLLPGADAAQARSTAERVRAAIERSEARLPDGTTLRVTASIGIAVCPDDGTIARDLVSAADQALYGAKRLGRNRVCQV